MFGVNCIASCSLRLVRWLSGLRHTLGKRAYRKVSGVRIPVSPPSLERSALARQAVLKTVIPSSVLGVRFSPSPPILQDSTGVRLRLIDSD
jgi:hypothetical protein